MKPEKFDPKEKNDKSETPKTVGKKKIRDMRDAKIIQKRVFQTHQKRFWDSIALTVVLQKNAANTGL